VRVEADDQGAAEEAASNFLYGLPVDTNKDATVVLVDIRDSHEEGDD
jgi:hypothetical protein